MLSGSWLTSIFLVPPPCFVQGCKALSVSGVTEVEQSPQSPRDHFPQHHSLVPMGSCCS